MSYDDEKFWDDYGAFLRESKKRHQCAAFALLHPRDVLYITDFGCGRYASASTLWLPMYYRGIDARKPGARLPVKRPAYDELIESDYRLETFEPRHDDEVFCSLFSSELTGPGGRNLAWYRELLDMGYKRGIVAGMYYRGSEDVPHVEEAGGIASWQTRPWVPPLDCGLKITQVCVNAPSEMFGPDVVEVWRLIERAA